MPNKASVFCPNGVKPCIGDSVYGVVLGKNELVHHKNGIRDDNTIDKLELMAHKQEHLPSMSVQNIIARQDKRIAQLGSRVALRVALLEADNARLESMLSGGRDSVPDNHEFKAL